MFEIGGLNCQELVWYSVRRFFDSTDIDINLLVLLVWKVVFVSTSAS